jgi:hypothetical protein
VTDAVTGASRTARQLWTLFEPVHAVTYFSPEARSAFEGAGLRGFWRGYFAGRAAPLGMIGAAPVTAAFFSFAPPMVARAIPAVWELIAPEEAVAVRSAGAAGIDGCEALALRAGMDLSREMLQPIRGWTDADWERAASRLAARGWLGADGRLTAEGAAAHRAVEESTDLAAARPWARLGPDRLAELLAVLRPVARACAADLPYPNPVGMPAPDA